MRNATWILLLVFLTGPGAPRSAEDQPVAGQAQPVVKQTEEDELEEFVPSEEISADKAISFPVDI